MFLLKYLIITAGFKSRICKGVFRTDDLTEIIWSSVTPQGFTAVFACEERRCRMDGRGDVEQPAHHLCDGIVEINKKRPPLFEKHRKIISIKLKKRRIAVSASDGIPVEMPPVAMVTDA